MIEKKQRASLRCFMETEREGYSAMNKMFYVSDLRI